MTTVWYRIEFIQDMEKGVERLVETEKGTERVEAGHEHVEGGRRMRREEERDMRTEDG